MQVRPETPADQQAIHAVHASAFPTPGEAQLVDVLRDAGQLRISLVAEDGGAVVGHIAFSPVSLKGVEGGLGLSPLAVLPEQQRRGLGAALVSAGIEACQRLGCPFVVLLGSPRYYSRFGFGPAAEHGLRDEFGGGEAFQVRRLSPVALPAGGGLVRYASQFDELE